MAIRPYEISLWTYNDRFLSVLVSSDTPKLGRGYEPHWTDGINGETKLTFTIPIKYFDVDTGVFVNNELWYNSLKQSHSLANEKKVKLIFDKLKKIDNNYAHEIYEFVIENLTEERDDTNLICRVECVGQAFKELGKTGTEIVLSAETLALEEEKNNTTLVPTANYWLSKVFPTPPADSNRVFWTYKIEIGNAYNLPSSRIYEKDMVIDWQVDGTELVPVYATSPIEKARFIDVANSNRYNITQDIAETFQVFVTYRYLYEDSTQPFRITGKQVYFYEDALEASEYSIVYGNNELGLSRTSDSSDVTTKMFVEKIESEGADDGFVSIARAQNNINKDDFILNFDYFIESGQLSSVQIAEIPVFEKALREKNIFLAQQSEESVGIDYRIAILEADISNLENKRNATNDNIIAIEDKLAGLNEQLEMRPVKDTDVLNTAKLDGNVVKCKPRRMGVLSAGLVVKDSDGTPVDGSNYSFIRDSYGYVTHIVFTAGSGIVDGTLLKLTYDYDLLSFYRNERASYIAMRDSVNSTLAIKNSQLTQAQAQKETADAQLETLSAQKQKLIDDFNALMAPFLKEGTWTESNYSPSYETKTLTTIPLVNDPIALTGEPLSYYKVGMTDTYYHYIKMPTTGIIADQIERVVIVESFTEAGIAIARELRYGAQYNVQMIYNKPVYTEKTYETTAEVDADTLPDGITVASHGFFIEQTNQVHTKASGTWQILAPEFAFVMDKDIKLDEAGHTFAIHTNASTGNTIIPVVAESMVAGNPYTIAQRRWYLTEDGKVNGAPHKNFQTTSLILRRSGLVLKEFDDYNITHNGTVKSVTLKINNNVPHSTTEFNAEFKLDISSEQLYRDALLVSQTSAFPEVSYNVSFVYLNQALNADIEKDLNQGRSLKLGNIVRITDYDMQIKGLKGIVTAIDTSLDRPEETSFTIQNYKTKFEDLFARIVASSEQMKTSGYLYDRVAGAFNPNMTLSSSILQQTLDSASFTLASSMGHGVSVGPQGLLAETAEPYPNGVKGQTWITGGNILLSNSINADGIREWTTALSPMGISANVIQTGRLDTGLVNIYSGGQIRFTWNAEGLFAYKAQENTGNILFDTHVRYNEQGLLFQERGKRVVELGWEGLYIGSQNGSVELTGTGGLEIYNAQEPRELLVKLGGFGTPNLNGVYPEYGMKLYKNRNGQLIETLVASNDGQLWLRDSLLVGTIAGMVGLTAENPVGVLDPIRIWAGNLLPEFAPFSVTDGGFVKATSGVIGGFSLTDKKLYHGTGALDYVGLGQDGNYRIWAGAVSQASAPFSITNAGHLTATSGAINGPFTVSGYLSSTYFASGAFGNGWRISGSGSAEFNDVYVRGTIAASVFEYQTISSVGGSLYVAPAIISLINSNQIAIVTNKYVITIPENFTNPQRGGHTWVVGDYVSLSGFIVKNNTSYELKDIRARVSSISGSGISLMTLSDVGNIICYDENDNTVNYASLSLAGAILMKRATIVLLGTYQGETAYNRGILINAVGNDTPFIDVYDDQNSTSGNPKVRLGNLSGIIDPNFGPGALSGYGLYAENAYLTGKIVATSGYIGGPNGWTITEGAMYNGGRHSILQNITGMYFGSDGFGLGGGLLYETEGNKLTISGDSIVMGIGLINEQPLAEYIDDQLGYRLEVLSTSNILSSDITEITIYTRVYKGQVDVTADLPDSVFHWTRVSNDAFADNIWNNNPINQGRKTFTLSTLDVYYSATFTCSIVE